MISPVSPLALPRLSRAGAHSQNLLAAAHRFAFTLGDQYGELRLLPGDGSAPAALSHWRCAAGQFSLGNGSAVLNMLSQCPFTTQDEAWQLALFNLYLSPQLAAFVGELQPGEAPSAPQVCARLQVRLDDRHAQCQLLLSHATLAHWLDQPGWQASYQTLSGGLIFSQPLRLGRITLEPCQLQALSAGDVLIPPVSWFTPQGQGSLLLGGQRLCGELQLPDHFLLNHLETPPLHSHDADPFESVPSPDPQPAALAALPLTLEVRCGRTLLTLGELQQLQPGSVLTLANVTPGEAGLYHGDTLLARGELVDVEGHLGLQLTRVMLSAPQEAG